MDKNEDNEVIFTEVEDSWRVQQLIYQPLDMGIIEMKLNADEYNLLSEFRADCLTIQHNIAVFHGCKFIYFIVYGENYLTFIAWGNH